MRHLDIFSGIGGFSLAVDRVWHEEENEHIFVEWDAFCTEVLKKHWPHATYHSDIRQFIVDSERNQHRPIATEVREAESIQGVSGETLDTRRIGRADIVTGGFPCQPFSQAGRRQGTSDDRYLWPEMFRVIQLYQPTWVIAENVGGLVTWNEGMVLEQVCTDLESEGYEVQTFIIPAVAVNAPHRRDRVWIVAHSQQDGAWDTQRRGHDERTSAGITGSDTDATNSESKHGERRDVRPRKTQFRRSDWRKSWPEVAARLCRMDDGVPRRLDRTPRLKALGNAIVPQVAEEIMKAIKFGDRLPTNN